MVIVKITTGNARILRSIYEKKMFTNTEDDACMPKHLYLLDVDPNYWTKINQR